MSAWEFTETELWRYNEDNVSIMHVFGCVAFGRNVVAFCEAREGDGSDAECAHSIYMRRSENGGKTFEDNVVLVPSHGNCYVNPTPVYDEKSRRLFLFFAQNLGNSVTQNYIMYSDNAGITWTHPQNITAALSDVEGCRFHLAGPGHGTQLKSGRLIVPFWHRSHGVEVPKEQRGYCVSFLYSDDSGKTWNHSPRFGYDCLANESRITQTKDKLIWNVRGATFNRYESYSTDDGDSWTEFSVAPIPPACRCDGSLVSLDAGGNYQDTVLFSHPSRTDARADMEVLISRDGGVTFDDKLSLMTGDAMPGYSDMCIIKEGDPVVGLVHARSNHVLFSRISMQTLTNGKYEKTERNVWINI